MVSYLFDVDGTLTPSRLHIEPSFEKFFLNWIKNKEVYLVSGSDYEKSEEQLGSTILEAVSGCFNSTGNVGYINGKRTYQNDWDIPKNLINKLENFLDQSPYPVRAGNHIERRIGMVNFSIVGRNCTYDQRKAYNKYDLENNERIRLCKEIMSNFPEIEASVGGEISIDIYPIGKNKGQVVDRIPKPIHFFGDRTEPGGNDHDIAKLLTQHPNRVFTVKNWNHTFEILKTINL